jgi:eukaryotic-like serine/threonine-protein kinase
MPSLVSSICGAFDTNVHESHLVRGEHAKGGGGAPSRELQGSSENAILAGRFRFDGPLAQGGMGDVFRGWHLSLDLPVAIKVLRKEYWGHPEVEALFEQEARVGARLRGPHVPHVFDFGRADGAGPFIVTELLDGIDVRTLLDRTATLAIDSVLRLFVGMCDAIGSVHAQGVVHRDVKPGNLFLATDSQGGTHLKLLDFGIAKLIDVPDESTGADFGVGSPIYMSPEQARSPNAVDARADIWSLGIVLYEMLAGRPPVFGGQFAAPEPDADPPFVPPSRSRPGVTAELDQLVLSCLHRRRDLRAPTVDELREVARRLAPASSLGVGSMMASQRARVPSRREG